MYPLLLLDDIVIGTTYNRIGAAGDGKERRPGGDDCCRVRYTRGRRRARGSGDFQISSQNGETQDGRRRRSSVQRRRGGGECLGPAAHAREPTLLSPPSPYQRFTSGLAACARAHTYSHTHSLTRTLIHAHTHSRTRSLTHTLTRAHTNTRTGVAAIRGKRFLFSSLLYLLPVPSTDSGQQCSPRSPDNKHRSDRRHSSTRRPNFRTLRTLLGVRPGPVPSVDSAPPRSLERTQVPRTISRSRPFADPVQILLPDSNDVDVSHNVIAFGYIGK